MERSKRGGGWRYPALDLDAKVYRSTWSEQMLSEYDFTLFSTQCGHVAIAENPTFWDSLGSFKCNLL